MPNKVLKECGISKAADKAMESMVSGEQLSFALDDSLVLSLGTQPSTENVVPGDVPVVDSSVAPHSPIPEYLGFSATTLLIDKFAIGFMDETFNALLERQKNGELVLPYGKDTFYRFDRMHANWERLDFIKSETIYLGDQMTPVHYIYSINSETAPDSTAGVWQGVADVSDGKPTYYIGHNPGVFAPVESFAEGSRFAVCDDNGNLGVYEVMRTIVILYEGTLWTEELERNSMPQGEYATLQTCRGDKVFMDIYVAKRIDG